MSIHVEWMSAADGVSLATAGTEIGEDEVSAGNLALLFGGDDVAVVEGTPEQIRNVLAAALAALDQHTAPVLPALPDPVADDDEDEGDATCPYVYTEADAERTRRNNAEYVARMREMHGGVANIYEAPVPVPGATCGADLNLWDKDPVRRSLYTIGGRWVAGPSSYADGGGGDEEVMCDNLHEWGGAGHRRVAVGSGLI